MKEVTRRSFAHPTHQDVNFKPNQEVVEGFDVASTSNRGYFEDMERDPNLTEEEAQNNRRFTTEYPSLNFSAEGEATGNLESSAKDLKPLKYEDKR